MAASFPGAVKSFTTKNTNEVIQASHMDDLQDEVTAIETGYLTGTARLNSSGSTLAILNVTGTSTFVGSVQMNTGLTISSAAGLQVGGGFFLQGTEGSTGPLSGSTAWDDLSMGAQTAVFQMNPSGNVALSGLSAGQTHGRTVLLQNVTSASTVTLLHNQTSLAANRFALSTAAGVVVAIGPNKAIWVHYSTTFSNFWRVVGL